MNALGYMLWAYVAQYLISNLALGKELIADLRAVYVAAAAGNVDEAIAKLAAFTYKLGDLIRAFQPPQGFAAAQTLSEAEAREHAADLEEQLCSALDAPMEGFAAAPVGAIGDGEFFKKFVLPILMALLAAFLNTPPAPAIEP